MVFKRSKAVENIKKSHSKDKKNIFQNQKEGKEQGVFQNRAVGAVYSHDHRRRCNFAYFQLALGSQLRRVQHHSFFNGVG